MPTANSVLSDIITVAKNIVMGTTGVRFNDYSADVKLAVPSEVVYPYYISLKVLDQPGQMLKLTEIMTKAQASFNLITQTQLDEDYARVTMVTHKMSEAQLNEIKAALAQLDTIEVIAAYKVLGG